MWNPCVVFGICKPELITIRIIHHSSPPVIWKSAQYFLLCPYRQDYKLEEPSKQARLTGTSILSTVSSQGFIFYNGNSSILKPRGIWMMINNQSVDRVL